MKFKNFCINSKLGQRIECAIISKNKNHILIAISEDNIKLKEYESKNKLLKELNALKIKK